jgi:hypothetical protein
MSMEYRLNNKAYEVPQSEVARLGEYIKNWSAGMPKKFTIDDDTTHQVRQAHVPASFTSVCFSIMLSEYAEANWSRYVVG